MSKKVADVLRRKSGTLISVTPETTVIDALQLMADKNIGAVLVMANGFYKGIMTERDYARKVILRSKSSSDTKVADIMSADLPLVTSNDSVDRCMQLMSENNIRYLPVMEYDQVTGILSINDLVKETIISQQETISHLTDYLHTGI